MFQLLVLALLPFVLCQDDSDSNTGFEDVYYQPFAPVSRYEDKEPLSTNQWKVQEVTRNVGVYGLWQYRLYQTDDDTYITTSHYDDKLTHTGPGFPVLKWDADDEVFQAVDNAFPQVDGNTRIRGTTGSTFSTYATDFLSVNYPFQTQDGVWWVYDTVGLVEDNRDRYRGEVSWSGEAYMRSWDEDSETWSDPAFTWRVGGSAWDHQYFVGADNREYVFTFNYGNDSRVPAWAQGVYQCYLLEYTSTDGGSSAWSVVTYGSGTTDDSFPACPSLPRNPVVFTSVEGEWIYLATSQGSPSCPSGVASCTVNKAVAPATWYTTTNNGRDTYRNFWNVSDRIDSFNIPALVEAKHWTEDGFDYIVALTDTGVATFRLWWTTHEVEELPFVSIAQPNLRFLDLFTVRGRQCFMATSSYQSMYPATPVPGAEDSWVNIYCWDSTHDNWDFAGAIPAEGTLWATVFQNDEDDYQYIVRVEEGHHQAKNVHVYRIYEEADQDVDIYYDVWSPSNDHIYKRVDRNGDRIHKTLAVSITALCVLIVIFVFILFLLYVSTNSGSGGGSTDYRGM